jgi:DNA-binding MarR family transcriptional regulator
MTPPVQLEHPDFYEIDTYTQAFCVGRLIRKVFNSILNQADEELAAFGLTYSQWFPLFQLTKSSSCTVLGLAKEIEVNPGALTRSLDRLEKKGLILRNRCPTDKRVVELTLTDQGKEIAARVPQVLSGVMNRHLCGLDRMQSQALIDSLQQMLISGEKKTEFNALEQSLGHFSDSKTSIGHELTP